MQPGGVTQRYIHLDRALILAANRVAAEIALLVVPNASVIQRNAAEWGDHFMSGVGAQSGHSRVIGSINLTESTAGGAQSSLPRPIAFVEPVIQTDASVESDI
jgi:hypothetical protein